MTFGQLIVSKNILRVTLFYLGIKQSHFKNLRCLNHHAYSSWAYSFT